MRYMWRRAVPLETSATATATSKTMKLHVGCGSVYLYGWVNVDVAGPNTFLAKDRPDLVERWGTTDDAYYAKHQDKTQDSMRLGPLSQEYVCDVYGTFSNLPHCPGDVQEVLSRQCFEHLSITEARAALASLHTQMATGGILRLDVPDHDAALELLRTTGDVFYIRHLLGPRRTDYGYHMMSYTREKLTALVEEYGFKLLREEPNIHFFPAFCLRFVRG